MTLPDVLVPTYVQMLRALSDWLAKAEAQMPNGGAEALLSACLAPDMFPLSTQVRFACVQALEGVFRLRGQAFPDSVELLLEEGRNAAERRGSTADARVRIGDSSGRGRCRVGRARRGPRNADRPHASRGHGLRPHGGAVRS